MTHKARTLPGWNHRHNVAAAGHQSIAGHLPRAGLGQNLVQQSGRNLRLSREKLQPLAAPARLFKQSRAGRADGHMRR